MNLLESVGVSILGLIIGSFLNVCIYRIPKKKSIVVPSSACIHCNKALEPLHLIPLLSYILLRGRCGYCKAKIPLRYPLVEFLNSVGYILLYKHFNMSLDFIFYCLLLSTLIVISTIDYFEKIIEDKFNLLLFLWGLIYKITVLLLGRNSSLRDGILGLIVGGGLFFLISILSKGAMGGGDIKLMGSLGFCLGFERVLLISFLSFLLGSLISLVLLFMKIKSRKDEIAFGPFISLATFISILYDKDLIRLYFSLLTKIY